MNPIIDLMHQHCSVRQFRAEPLTTHIITQLVRAAQTASTSSYKQSYSIIGITQPHIKKSLAEIAEQPYVENCGHLFVFVADNYRHSLICRQANMAMQTIQQILGSSEEYTVSAIDAALAAQNLVLAAESMALGACFIGALRNNAARVIELLDLPPYTFPLFGLIVGYPLQQVSLSKPRLPLNIIYHENRYQHDPNLLNPVLDDYDQQVNYYYQQRSHGKRTESWRGLMCKAYQSAQRLAVHAAAKAQGFLQQ